MLMPRTNGKRGDSCKTPLTVVQLRGDALAGTLDGVVESEIGFHFYTASKANWWPITDDKPQYPDARPT